MTREDFEAAMGQLGKLWGTNGALDTIRAYVDSLVTPEECKDRCSEVFMVSPALDCDDFDAWYARQYENKTT